MKGTTAKMVKSTRDTTTDLWGKAKILTLICVGAFAAAAVKAQNPSPPSQRPFPDTDVLI
jgi:hypothetical protein